MAIEKHASSQQASSSSGSSTERAKPAPAVRVGFFRRLLDLISPRLCMVCGQRLSPTEEVLCAKCNLHLPRTGFQRHAEDNPVARLFWGQLPVERATALYYYESHAESANIIHELKYHNHPEVGVTMGRMVARELRMSGYFEGIEGIVPVPLAKRRERQRGYNQSMEIARGVSEVTGLPIVAGAVRRTVFEGSQTSKGRWDRLENVERVFELVEPEVVRGRHLLLIDDVVTTGATMIACGQALAEAGEVRLSVLALGFAGH